MRPYSVPLRTLHLFAGGGGGIYADLLLGHRPVCAVEINADCQRVMADRQAAGVFPWFPIFDDVQTFDGKPWAGVVDAVCGGFPCTDISAAGKGAGIDGEKSGLWKEMARVIGEIRPRHVFVENSPMLVVRGLGRVLGDLSSMGYDAAWGIVSAAEVGAAQLRERCWILATLHGTIAACVDSAWQPQPEGANERQRGRSGDKPQEVADTDRRRAGRAIGFVQDNNAGREDIARQHGNGDGAFDGRDASQAKSFARDGGGAVTLVCGREPNESQKITAGPVHERLDGRQTAGGESLADRKDGGERPQIPGRDKPKTRDVLTLQTWLDAAVHDGRLAQIDRDCILAGARETGCEGWLPLNAVLR